MRTSGDHDRMVGMMESFPSPENKKEFMSPNEGGELSAAQLADALKASREERGPMNVGEIDTVALRDAVSRARENPVTL